MFKKSREIKESFILLNKNVDRNSFSQAIFRQIILKLAKVLFLGRNSIAKIHYGQISVNLTIFFLFLMLADNFTLKDVHFTNFLSKCFLSLPEKCYFSGIGFTKFFIFGSNLAILFWTNLEILSQPGL